MSSGMCHLGSTMTERRVVYILLDDDPEIEECPVCEHQSLVVFTGHRLDDEGVKDIGEVARRCIECHPPSDDDDDDEC